MQLLVVACASEQAELSKTYGSELARFLPHNGFAVASSVASLGLIRDLTPHTPAQEVRPNSAFGQVLASELARSPSRGALVQSQNTPLSSAEASNLLHNAWREVTGSSPSPKTLAILTSQWAHETAHGAHMYNYNFGGIKGTGPSGLSVAKATREGFGASERRITDNFRAYASAAEGARDYVQLLASRYKTAVNAASAGDAAGFVRGLKTAGYFTGDENAYTNSVVSMSSRFLSQGFDSQVPSVESPQSARADASPAAFANADFVLPALSDTVPGSFIDAMTLTDELGRAALRIAQKPGEKG